MIISITIIFALIIDQLAGEIKKWHPLVGFGLLANKVEASFRSSDTAPDDGDIFTQRLRGALSLMLVTLPFVFACYLLVAIPEVAVIVNIIVLYFALGGKSLKQHAREIHAPLVKNNIAMAKQKIQLIVSRDTKNMTENDISKATIESVLENGNDAIFGTLFWFLLAGAPGAVLFRLVNTLDAMWGYRSERFLHFGWAAAKLDDVMNYIPARLTALSYACTAQLNSSIFKSDHFKNAIFCWRTQAKNWDSPNAGPVMAAGAGALSIKLGGTACYQNQFHHRPTLGTNNSAKSNDINSAIKLVDHSVILWVVVISGVSLLA